MGLIEEASDKGFVITKLEYVVGWARKYSLFPMPFGTACCAIEMMATLASRHDLSRFGAEAMRSSPRQADLMLVAGTIVHKMVPVLERIYEQMSEPKWVIAMGACASSGGMFDTYSVLQGIDEVIPVDIYIAGCPPRPEALLDGFIKLQEKIQAEPKPSFGRLADLPPYEREDNLRPFAGGIVSAEDF